MMINRDMTPLRLFYSEKEKFTSLFSENIKKTPNKLKDILC